MLDVEVMTTGCFPWLPGLGAAAAGGAAAPPPGTSGRGTAASNKAVLQEQTSAPGKIAAGYGTGGSRGAVVSVHAIAAGRVTLQLPRSNLGEGAPILQCPARLKLPVVFSMDRASIRGP